MSNNRYDVLPYIIVIILVLFILFLNNTEQIEPITNIERDTSDNLVISDNPNSSDNLDSSDTSNSSDTPDNLNYPENLDNPNVQIITAGLGPEVRRLADLEARIDSVNISQIENTNVIRKLYERDVMGDYKRRGWFVQIHDVLSTPHGVSLGANIGKYYGIRRLCFRAQNNFAFLGEPQDPIYLPKPTFVGFRAMTVYKIPKTGYYDFKILSDDGAQLMYQIVDSDVILSEKNIRNLWTPLVEQWNFQTESWGYSPKIYFNQSDLILLRFDYFQADGNSTACIKVRYSEVIGDFTNDGDDEQLQGDYDDPKIFDMHCSLLWSQVPLMGKS